MEVTIEEHRADSNKEDVTPLINQTPVCLVFSSTRRSGNHPLVDVLCIQIFLHRFGLVFQLFVLNHP